MSSSALKLDFRFADEMDGMELVQFVNEAHSVETGNEEGNPLCFRRELPKLSIEEVREN